MPARKLPAPAIVAGPPRQVSAEEALATVFSGAMDEVQIEIVRVKGKKRL